MGDYLGRDAILSADALKREDVSVPEWGGTVCVQELTGTQRDAYEASMRQQRGRNFVLNQLNIRAKLAVLSIIDPETGERLFTDQEANALGKLSAAALDRVFDAAARLSRISEEDVDEMAGKSGMPLNDDSIST